MTRLHYLLVAALCAVSATAEEPNWVGPQVGKTIGKACYRKTYVTGNKQCGVGYSFDTITTCWTQCPIEYPVECGMECIPQNEDCAKEVFDKVASVATVALNAATAGVFGKVASTAKAVTVGVRCGEQLFGIAEKIKGFVDEVEKGSAGDTPKDQILFAVMKTDFVVYDLPAAVAICIGKPIPARATQAKEIIDNVKAVVELVVNSLENGVNVLDLATFLIALKKDVPAVSKGISPADQKAIEKLSSGFSCGSNVYSVVNKIVASVQDFKTKDPNSAVDTIKFAVLQSELVLKDLPEAASACANTTAGFAKRDEILKLAHVIIDKVIESSSSQDGKPLTDAEYAITVTNMGLDVIATIDPTGIAAMAKEFIQPICGPTAFLGDIDSGSAEEALGLSMIGKAFRDTSGQWSAQGNGQLSIKFTSVDDQDVAVNVLSGGQKVGDVPVKAGATVEWSKPLSDLAGKTLHMDRWRPGFLGVSGTGGGSLLAWVPTHAATGSLTLEVKIYPTSFSDNGSDDATQPPAQDAPTLDDLGIGLVHPIDLPKHLPRDHILHRSLSVVNLSDNASRPHGRNLRKSA